MSAYLTHRQAGRLAYPITEVTQISEELVVASSDKVGPQESRVVRLGSL